MKISTALIFSILLSSIHPSTQAADPKTNLIFSIIFRASTYCMANSSSYIYFRNENEAKTWLKEALNSVDVTMNDYYSVRDSDPILFGQMVKQYIKDEGGCEAMERNAERFDRAQQSKAPALQGKDAADPFQW